MDAIIERLNKAYLTPQRSRVNPEFDTLVADGRSATLAFAGKSYPYWVLGDGPKILVLHGWGGNASQLRRFIPPLLEAGYSVVTTHLPGHALETRMTDNNELARYIAALAQDVGEVQGVIAHSMGAQVAMQAFVREAPALNESLHFFVTIAAPAHPIRLREGFNRLMRLEPEVIEAHGKVLEERFGAFDTWDEYAAEYLGPRIGCPGLIIHGSADQEVPADDVHRIGAKWDGASVELFEGCDHYSLLREPAVIERTVEFARQQLAPDSV